MITSEIITNILYKICKEKFDLPTYQPWVVPEGEVKEPRIVVFGCELIPETIWYKGTAEVHLVAPKLHEKVDKVKLDELSMLAKEKLDHGILYYDGETIKYEYEKSAIEEDTQLRSHFVKVKVKIKVLNVK